MKKSNPPFAQSDLYLVLAYICQLCEAIAAEFTAFSPRYKAPFLSNFKTAIDAAADLPDQIARYAPVKMNRMAVVDANDDIIQHFLMLQSYIKKAYSNEDTVKTMLSAAGKQYYDKAQGNSWSSVKALLSAAILFIQNNEAALLANENMPTDFLARFTKVKATYETAYQEWNTKDAASYNWTTEKSDASADLYDTAVTLLEDAQIILRKQPELAKKYTMTAVKAQVLGTHAAGVGGKVMILGTKTVLNNVSITLVELNKSVKTNANGRFEIFPIASGEYTLRIEAEGYKTITLDAYEIKIGTIGRLNVEMEAVEIKKLEIRN